MAVNVSLEGIDEAISNLNYKNPEALKTKFVNAIRDRLEVEGSNRFEVVKL